MLVTKIKLNYERITQSAYYGRIYGSWKKT